jgi:hypothetical protein
VLVLVVCARTHAPARSLCSGETHFAVDVVSEVKRTFSLAVAWLRTCAAPLPCAAPLRLAAQLPCACAVFETACGSGLAGVCWPAACQAAPARLQPPRKRDGGWDGLQVSFERVSARRGGAAET